MEELERGEDRLLPAMCGCDARQCLIMTICGAAGRFEAARYLLADRRAVRASQEGGRGRGARQTSGVRAGRGGRTSPAAAPGTAHQTFDARALRQGTSPGHFARGHLLRFRSHVGASDPRTTHTLSQQPVAPWAYPRTLCSGGPSRASRSQPRARRRLAGAGPGPARESPSHR